MGNKTSKSTTFDNYFSDIFNINQKWYINFFPSSIILKIMEYCHGGNLPSKEYFNISLVCKIWRSYSIGSIKSIKLVPQHMENLLIPYKPRVLEEAIKSIQQIIVNGISLESIDFSNGELDLQRMRHLTDSLKLNSTIRHLNFQYCYLDSESVELLAQVLSVNRSIQHLDLSYNKITHSGALCLAKSILNNHILQSMDLSNNEIGNQGALAISEILILNKSTVKINLSQNQIGGDGVIAIIKARQKINNSSKTSFIYKSGLKLLTEDGKCTIIKSQ